MGITLPTVGQSAWATPLNLALADLAHSGINARDLGYKMVNYMPGAASVLTAGALASGTVRTVKMPRLTQAETITGAGFIIGTAASGATAGQCFVGLYSVSGTTGTRVALSADISGSLGSTGLIKYPFTAPYAATPGDYVVAMLFNGTTGPQLGAQSAGGISSIVNGDLTAGFLLVANNPTAQTSLPASIDLTTRTGVGAYTFGGLY